LLTERGVVERFGQRGFHTSLQRINQEDLPQVTPSLQHLVAIVHEHLGQIETHLAGLEEPFKHALQDSAVAQRVQTIFGVGPVTATACAAEYAGGVDRFHDSHQFAASLGIPPSEHASGEKRRHGSVTKRGNPYRRTLLVQCANAIVNLRNRREDALCQLARHGFAQDKRRAVVIVAIANRLARSIYTVIRHRTVYAPNGRHAATAVA
ncbi:MAG: transposase, partial [Rhodanobacteraceae bacterium]